MRRNLCAADRLFRLVLALTLLPLTLVLDGHARLIGLAGILPLGAAIVGWSPIYALFGVRSAAAGSAHTLPMADTAGRAATIS